MHLARGADRYVGALAVFGLVGLPLSPLVTAGFVGFALFTAWFFRDPDRDTPNHGIVSPADGTISVVREDDDRLRVGVFMNVTDVHVNRAPIGGEVTAVTHEPGAHRPAFTKDSDRNERVRISFPDHEVVLIAGAFARRITPYVEARESVDRGQRIGHIAFGSRADVLFPPSVDRADLKVEEGESVRAGETLLATDPA